MLVVYAYVYLENTKGINLQGHTYKKYNILYILWVTTNYILYITIAK